MADVCMKFHLRRGLGVRETELNTQTKHCSAKREKCVKVSNNRCQWAVCGCEDGFISVDVSLFLKWI